MDRKNALRPLIVFVIVLTLFFSLLDRFKRVKRKKDEMGKKIYDKIENLDYSRDILSQMILRRDEEVLKKYIELGGYKAIGLYGWGQVGQCAYAELKACEHIPVCVIDRNCANLNSSETIIYSPLGLFPQMDLLIVTPTYYFDEIEKEMASRVGCKIISIDDIYYNVDR